MGDSYPDKAINIYGAGSDLLMITVNESGGSIVSTARKVLIPLGWNFLSTSRIVNLTSALVNGLPSWKETFSCNLKVMTLPSGLTVQDLAKLGYGFNLKSYSSNPS